ncbi:hypothetical protein WJX73_004531 [Symbiochloris irregularis]|uniref:CBS domain-containing protein n=1 Tax=Symbiochloris irregularis TaxID=706552 RepID=A0AAW1NNV6_9CHLO
MAAFFVPTRFTWRFGGQVVHLCGSFTRWVETVPMSPVQGSPGLFAVVVHLPPGYHQYKFVVDGQWRHDEGQPFMPDPLGNVNNWLFVRRSDQMQSSQEQLSPIPSGSLGHTGAGSPPLNQAASLQHQPSGPQTGLSSAMAGLGQSASSAGPGDVDMQSAEASADSASSPIIQQVEEPAYTRRRVKDFLRQHTCYELIPESGKVVLIDLDLPVRQAFHALHEQGVPSAPLCDGETGTVVGMISASDFIHVLQQLRSSVSSSGPLNEAEMDQHTVRAMRDAAQAEGKPHRRLVWLTPAHSLHDVIVRLFETRSSMAPVLSSDPAGEGQAATLLHIATISGVLACLMRHFRASLASLPLLAQPISALPLGTWCPHSSTHLHTHSASTQGLERRDKHRVREVHTVRMDTPLTTALSTLLEAGVSALPVVDERGVLVDMYARSDITQLARSSAYSRLQYEDVTVGQALALAAAQPQQWPPTGPSSSPARPQESMQSARSQRVHVCTPRESLRSVVERLSVPGPMMTMA